MKKQNLFFKYSCLLLLIILKTISVDANIWRVNNRSNYDGVTLFGSNYGGTLQKPVFNNIEQADAWNGAFKGDTIYVEGSPDVYPPATIYHERVIIGAGYYLDYNDSTSSDRLETKVAHLIFMPASLNFPGSSNSTVMGIHTLPMGNISNGTFHIGADSITISRCRIDYQIVIFTPGLQRLTVTQNLFSDTLVSNAFEICQCNGVPPIDIIFNNNICKKTLYLSDRVGNPKWAVEQCNNNIFTASTNQYNTSEALYFQVRSQCSNNIVIGINATVDVTGGPGVISHNMGTQSSQFGTSNNNLLITNINSLFLGGASPDAYYKIQPSSQAYQNGSDGGDRGPYGGQIISKRYSTSGLAPIPVIYEAVSSGVVSTSTGIEIRIKAKTIK